MDGDEESSALAALARGMEANPVFAMSLGSKELFHSDLLGWFIRHHRPVAEALGLRGEVTVLREKDHTDLPIRHGRQQVRVIENKVLALPDPSQPARPPRRWPGSRCQRARAAEPDLARLAGRHLDQPRRPQLDLAQLPAAG